MISYSLTGSSIVLCCLLFVMFSVLTIACCVLREFIGLPCLLFCFDFVVSLKVVWLVWLGSCSDLLV